MKRRAALRWVSAATVLAAVAVLLAAWLLNTVLDQRSPGELIRYTERRLLGHPKLEAVALPVLGWWRRQTERQAPADLPTLGRGPLPQAWEPASTLASDTLTVASVPALARALRDARPGQTIELAPGSYRITHTLVPTQAGRADAPITLRAARPGSVWLESATTEAFKLAQPHWVIEHLNWRGVCAQDHDCEHALHVVGAAVGSVIRHNRLLDFNAAIKVNGEGGRFPDGGHIHHNQIANAGPRRTDRPVTMIDIVAASGWVVSDNLIARFVKDGGNGISYGVFLKGGGRGGRIERNLVVCTPGDISVPGVRVALSLGGGGTSEAACREQPCLVEQHDGVIANNIVAHCNDVGIDVNRSVGSEVRHNTLINTAGITVRGEPSFARARANLLDGRVRARAPALVSPEHNLAADLRGWLDDPDALALGWRRRPDAVPTADEAMDACGRPRGALSLPGALADAPC